MFVGRVREHGYKRKDLSTKSERKKKPYDNDFRVVPEEFRNRAHADLRNAVRK